MTEANKRPRSKVAIVSGILGLLVSIGLSWTVFDGNWRAGLGAALCIGIILAGVNYISSNRNKD